MSWPSVDEDDYREMATAMREFADDIDEGHRPRRPQLELLL
ncbi:hypothetical protein ACWD6P_07645 [Streptomyces sp. NPDC002446]